MLLPWLQAVTGQAQDSQRSVLNSITAAALHYLIWLRFCMQVCEDVCKHRMDFCQHIRIRKPSQAMFARLPFVLLGRKSHDNLQSRTVFGTKEAA